MSEPLHRPVSGPVSGMIPVPDSKMSGDDPANGAKTALTNWASTTAPFLPGTGVAIVAPGGYAPDEAALARAVAGLREQGCDVHCYYDANEKHLRFGGTDEGRLAQIHAAARNPDVQVVMALRGGYGMSRLLPAIDFDLLASSGKLLVGHSDFTALQMGLLAHCGAVSFSGPMICDDFTRPQRSEFTMRQFRDCLTLPQHVVRIEAGADVKIGVGVGVDADLDMPRNPVVETEGLLWGGNLTMLTHLAGTPYLPVIDGGILFIEDVNEHPYRVERMLLQLLHTGILEKQHALLLGDFSAYRLSDYDNGYDFSGMLSFLRARISVPILTGLPFGHIPDKLTLPVGARAGLKSTVTGWELTMAGPSSGRVQPTRR